MNTSAERGLPSICTCKRGIHRQIGVFCSEATRTLLRVCEACNPTILKNPCYLACMACLATLLSTDKRARMNGEKEKNCTQFHGCNLCATGYGQIVHEASIWTKICAPIQKEGWTPTKIMRELEKGKQEERKQGRITTRKSLKGAIRCCQRMFQTAFLLSAWIRQRANIWWYAPRKLTLSRKRRNRASGARNQIFIALPMTIRWGQDYASENSYHAVVRFVSELAFLWNSGCRLAVSSTTLRTDLITRFSSSFVICPTPSGQERPNTPIYGRGNTTAKVDKRLEQIYLFMKKSASEGRKRK